MAIVTYIPRMVPLVFFDPKKLPQPVQATLKNVPYAALGALIFPGILVATDQMWMAITAGIVAGVFAYFGSSLLIVVIASIVTVLLLTLI
ncbi:branched-chain amino acid transporter [Alkalihalobacillus pseudalcaliphilus]|nr:branched-chain amino acid transporter [Alkalihalobacillus pseudalcaliphilus]